MIRVIGAIAIGALFGAPRAGLAAPPERCAAAWQTAQTVETAESAWDCMVACLRVREPEVVKTWMPTCRRLRTARIAAEKQRKAAARAQAVRDALAAKRPPYKGPRPGAVVARATRRRPALHYMPLGTFMVGSPLSEAERSEDEEQFAVTLTAPFLMMRTEVTQAQWTAVMGSAPAYFTACGPNCPVERVSWFGAATYANRLSKAEGRTACYTLTDCRGTVGGACAPSAEGGRFCEGDYTCTVGYVDDCTGYRLPSEAQWEYAARADSSAARSGPIDAVAWYAANAGGTSHPVGQKAPNAWGLHDMLGNVWEWAEDWGGRYPGEHAVDWRDLKPGVSRTVRGGAWRYGAAEARAAYRSTDLPTRRLCDLGFRLVRAVKMAR